MRRIVASLLRIALSVISIAFATVVAMFIYFRRPTMGADRPVAHAHALSSNLRSAVDALTSTFAPRCAANPAKLGQAAGFIAGKFRASGARVFLQPYRDRLGHEFENVVATFGPASGERIVVGAHYDAFCETGRNPGADDNASGTAGLLELARILGREHLSKRVDLVAFSTEEPPYFASDIMGSAAYARSLRAQNAPVAAMICLEMIGYFVERQPAPSALLGLLYPRRGDFIVVVGRSEDAALARRMKRAMNASDIRTVSFNGPSTLGTDASDQRSFWENGFPAVMITDTSYIRNPNYHTGADTASTLDYGRMAGVVDGVANAVLHLAKD